MDPKELRLAWAAWAAVCFFWGTTYLAIRIGVQALPPFLFAGLRIGAAGLLLLVFLRSRGESLPRGREWLHLGLIGISLLGVGNGVLSWSAQWVPSGFLALLIAMTPFWMVGFEALLPGGDRLSSRAGLGLALGFGGLALLVWPRLSGPAFDERMLLGLLALQFVCASWAAGSLYSRRQPVSVKPLMGAAVQMLVSGVMLTLIGTLLGEWPRFRFDPSSLAVFLYLLVFGSIVGYGSYIYVLQKLPVSTVSLYTYVNPVIAVFLGWAVAGETLTWREAAAAAVVLGGVALVKGAPRGMK